MYYRRRIRFKEIILSIPIGIIIRLTVSYSTVSMDNLIPYILTALTFPIFGGLGEEIYFRGILYDELLTETRWFNTVFLQALAFDFSHLWNPMVVLGAFIFGLFQGLVRKYHGLEVCIGIHYGINIFTHT
jgi:membrane protease YdiL (CAAX protease family)